MHLTPLNHFFSDHREEIPPEKDQWEEAAHKGVDRQAAAVCHLEDGERVLWVCTGAVPVRPGACCQRKGWRTLPAGSKLLLWENLPQKLMMQMSVEEFGEDSLYRLRGAVWDEREGTDYSWRCERLELVCVELQNNPPLTQRSRRWLLCYSHLCRPTGRVAHVSSAGCVPSSSRAFTPFHLRDKGRRHRRPLLAHGWKRKRYLQQLIRPWLPKWASLFQTKPFHWLRTVWLCFAIF